MLLIICSFAELNSFSGEFLSESALVQETFSNSLEVFV